MSDDFNGYYNAWCQVFDKPENHLLCIWHVKRNWAKHLNTIRNSQLRDKPKTDLFELQKTLDVAEFGRLFDFFKSKYRPEAEDFIDYLESHYGNRVNQWAACYRKNWYQYKYVSREFTQV